MASQQQGTRQRSRMACEPCRDRKRKCGGGKPCDLCANFGYTCYYRATPRKRRRRSNDAAPVSRHPPAASPPKEGSVVPSDAASQHNGSTSRGVFERSLESNSGSAFVRSFALAVDPSNAPPFQTLAWNLFLGERQVVLPAIPQSITYLFSQTDMQALADIYVKKVDPCYGFLDRASVEKAIQERWSPAGQVSLYDAVLCGVGAIACVFSNLQDLQIENGLVALAKSLLDGAVSEEPNVDTATAWLLRTVYLRLTARPEETWIASCTALHMIDATGLHCESDPNTLFRRAGISINPETRKRIFGVARHVNIWLSFDLARSRLILQNASLIPPSPRSGDYTTELLGLLPHTELLDPGKALSGSEIVTAFSEVLGRTHSEPPSILAQCNLMLCLYRRLYTLKWKIPAETLDKAVSLIRRGLAAVHANVSLGSPWHHLANVPFQSICTLLAIDTAQSFSLLAEAISCLELVTQTYRTRATKDALSAARTLIFMHQKRREADVKRQSEMLNLYPVAHLAHDDGLTLEDPLVALSHPGGAFTGSIPWFNELIPEADLNLVNWDHLFAT